MTPKFPDKRKAIAGEFFLSDSKIRNHSRKAFKKIQTYKESMLSVQPDNVYQQQIENLVRHSFFHTVTNSFILVQERFYENALDN